MSRVCAPRRTCPVPVRVDAASVAGVASVGAVTSRSDNPPGDPSGPPSAAPSARAGQVRSPDPDTPERSPASRLTAAIAVAGLAALLVGLAPLFGLVRPQTPPAFASWPLLLGLAVLPPLLAAGFARGQRITPALGVLIGPALLAPGRLVADAQLLADAGLAARPALLSPHDLEPITPSAGLWVLLAGHAATGVAGVIAAWGGSGDRVPDPLPGAGFEAGAFDRADSAPQVAEAGTRRQGLLAAVLLVTVVAAAGALMAQFASDNPYLVPEPAVDSPLPVLLGNVLIAVGVLTAGGLFASAADPGTARGGLLGLAAAVAGIAVPPLFAAAVVEELHYGWGAVLELLAALALAGLAVPAGRTAAGDRDEEEVADVRLPSLQRLFVASGVLAVLAGVLALAGAAAPQLEMPLGAGEITPYAAPMLLPSGLVLVALGSGMFLPRVAARIRPALPVVCAALLLAAAATLDTVLTAVQAAGARAGVGAWAAGIAVLTAVAAALVAAVAGGVERDDVDLTELPQRRAGAEVPVLRGLSVPAALLAFGTFGLPVVVAPGYTPPGVFTDFSTTSWGLVAALVSVVLAVALAPFCRSERAAALLGGAALVVLVRVLELPLTAGRAASSEAGVGLWFGLVCLAVLVGTAALAARRSAVRAG